MHDQSRASSPPEGSYRPPRRSGFVASGSARTADPSSAPPPPLEHPAGDARAVTIAPAHVVVIGGVLLAAAIAVWQMLR